MIWHDEQLLWGFVGGLLSQFLRLIRHASLPKDKRPVLLSDPWFWVEWLTLGLLGGILSFAYERSGLLLKPIVAINIGAAAPLIIEKLTSSVPAIGKTN